jgi:superfamily I DNA and/or RNA helicase
MAVYIQSPSSSFIHAARHAYESAEEEDRVARLIADLLRTEVRSADGKVRKLTPNDVLIVTAYNMQVRRIGRGLPNFWLGRVDKFGGHKAAVVIVPMCADVRRHGGFISARN